MPMVNRGGALVEVGCTFDFDGNTYEAGGAEVAPGKIVAYMGRSSRRPEDTELRVGDVGQVTSWKGEPLGTFEVISAWPTPGNWESSWMYAVRISAGGREYHGRTRGPGMVVMGKACKSR